MMPRTCVPIVCASIVAALAVLAAAPAQSQSYPARPVTIVVPLGAGGGSDLLARLVAQKLERRLGKPFVIENRPGGGTTHRRRCWSRAPTPTATRCCRPPARPWRST